MKPVAKRSRDALPAASTGAVSKPAPRSTPSNQLLIVDDGRPLEERVADLAVEGVFAATATTMTYAGGQLGKLDLASTILALRKQIGATKDGDMGIADTLLVTQAVSLNAIFHECVRRAALNLGENLEAVDRYMRIALKAQSQSRASLESLSLIKNPRTLAYVQQANIANGPQQVNNGGTTCAPVESQTPPSKLLESTSAKEWMDTRAPGASVTSNPPVEAMATVHGPKVGRRKKAGLA